MDNKEFLTEKLLKAKRKGKLKPKYQAMTDEELLQDFFSRLEEARMRLATLTSRQIIELHHRS